MYKVRTLKNTNLNSRLGIFVIDQQNKVANLDIEDMIELAVAANKKNNKYEVGAGSIKKYIKESVRSKTNDVKAKLTFYKDGNKLSKKRQKILNDTINLISYKDIRFGPLIQNLLSTKHLAVKRKELPASVAISELIYSGY